MPTRTLIDLPRLFGSDSAVGLVAHVNSSPYSGDGNPCLVDLRGQLISQWKITAEEVPPPEKGGDAPAALTIRVMSENGRLRSVIDEIPRCSASGETLPELLECIGEAVKLTAVDELLRLLAGRARERVERSTQDAAQERHR